MQRVPSSPSRLLRAPEKKDIEKVIIVFQTIEFTICTSSVAVVASCSSSSRSAFVFFNSSFNDANSVLIDVDAFFSEINKYANPIIKKRLLIYLL